MIGNAIGEKLAEVAPIVRKQFGFDTEKDRHYIVVWVGTTHCKIYSLTGKLLASFCKDAPVAPHVENNSLYFER